MFANVEYGDKEVRLSSEGRDIFVTSDLHIAAGLGPDGRFAGTENFFADDAYVRFLNYASATGNNPILIINGDFIDFLRIKEIPESDDDFLQWQSGLARVGIVKSLDELRGSIVQKERTFGLRTNDYKSIWRLILASRGHAPLFAALARWIEEGHPLIITKGNHDLEWYHPKVRDYLCVLFRELRPTANTSDLVLFVDNSLVIDGIFYIEHGHCYDKYATVIGPPLLKETGELNIPFGSFFNRYLLNRIELVYPYLDNIKPRENLLPLLIKEHFPLALKVLFYHVPFLIRVIPKRYYRYMFTDFLVYVLALGLPFLGVAYIIYQSVSGMITTPNPAKMSWIATQLVDFSKSIGMLVASYLLARIVAIFKLTEPSSLEEFARKKFVERPELRIITMGHTHCADQNRSTEQQFFNTGTWIPVIETSSGNVSPDRTFTYLHLRNQNGALEAESLLRWNDDALRPDPLTIIGNKE